MSANDPPSFRSPHKTACDDDFTATKFQKVNPTGEHSSPMRPVYTLNSLNAAIDHYFSPKRKSPKQSSGTKSPKSPSRSSVKGTTTKVDFSRQEQLQSDSDNENENVESIPLGCVESATCDLGALKAQFTKHDENISDEFKQNIAQAEKQFSKWLSWVRTGEFNILLHGLGSKLQLLEKFLEYLQQETETPCFVVQGYKPSACVRKILDHLVSRFNLPGIYQKNSLEQYAQLVREKFEENDNKMFLIVHSIDSQGLRAGEQQAALSILANSKNIHLIASSDHVNASLLWRTPVCDKFSWLYVAISTGKCYGTELLVSDSRALGLNSKSHGRNHTHEAIEAFWAASTSNSRKILEQLTIHAPAATEKDKSKALSIPSLCRILKEEFATTSETILRQQLIEFEDHQLIKKDKNDNIVLLVERRILASFLEEKLKQ